MTKAILKCSYSSTSYMQMKDTKKASLSLMAVKFWPTFNIQISITLARFWEKFQNDTFQEAHRSLSKHAITHINRGSHYEIMAL